MSRPDAANGYTYPPTGQVTREDYYTDEEPRVNYNKPIGRCPNCSDIIFEGEGSTVHDRCWNEYKAYLESDWKRHLDYDGY